MSVWWIWFLLRRKNGAGGFILEVIIRREENMIPVKSVINLQVRYYLRGHYGIHALKECCCDFCQQVWSVEHQSMYYIIRTKSFIVRVVQKHNGALILWETIRTTHKGLLFVMCFEDNLGLNPVTIFTIGNVPGMFTNVFVKFLLNSNFFITFQAVIISQSSCECY